MIINIDSALSVIVIPHGHYSFLCRDRDGIWAGFNEVVSIVKALVTM